MVRKEDLVAWEDRLVENETYVMHNFKILKNQGHYHVYDHAFKLFLFVPLSLKYNHFLISFNFKSIKKIRDGDFYPSTLIGCAICLFVLFFSCVIIDANCLTYPFRYNVIIGSNCLASI